MVVYALLRSGFEYFSMTLSTQFMTSYTQNVFLTPSKAINLDNKKIKRQDHIKRIKSEVEILKKLEDHPRVIKFIDCFHYEKDQNIFCIVLEWAENGDLKDGCSKNNEK